MPVFHRKPRLDALSRLRVRITCLQDGSGLFRAHAIGASVPIRVEGLTPREAAEDLVRAVRGAFPGHILLAPAAEAYTPHDNAAAELLRAGWRGGRPKRAAEVASSNLSVRLTPTERAALDGYAAQHKSSAGDLVRQGLILLGALPGT